MVVIRLARTGAKKRPFYNLVVADVRAPRDGRFIEKIGFYNPVARGQEITLNMDLEAYNAWIVKGAKPTDRAKALYKLSLKNDGNSLAARFEKTRKIPNDKAKPVKTKPVAEASEEAPVVEVSSDSTVEASEEAPVVEASSDSTAEASEEAPVVEANSDSTAEASEEAPVVEASSDSTAEASEEVPVVEASSDSTAEASEEAPVVEASSDSTAEASEEAPVAKVSEDVEKSEK